MKEGFEMSAQAKRSLINFNKDNDMTHGSIVRHLFSFSLPLLIGYVFQMLYNTVDTWVVGNYVSNEAFSAVGTVGPIINMLIGIFTGLSSGVSVVISQYYGAKRDDKVHDAVHSAVFLTLIMGAAFTLIGVLFTPLMLRLTDTPANVFPESATYLKIYFSGILGLMLYNMCAGILRAVGDSFRPFLFLVVSALLNTVLDLLFVLGFGMGVDGVAYATIIAQSVSAVLLIIYLMRTDTCIKFRFHEMRIHKDIFKKIIHVGLPGAIQMSITSFSNVFVQSYINHFGADFMSGWTVYGKIDQIVILPVQSLSLASTTFVGQNLGSRLTERAKTGVSTAVRMALLITSVIAVPVVIFAPQLTAFFNAKPEVIHYGTLMLRIISPFIVICCFHNIYAGALRGSGNSRTPMIIMLFSFVFFRQLYLFVTTHFISNSELPVIFAYPAGWMICFVITSIYYHKVGIDKNRLIEETDAASA